MPRRDDDHWRNAAIIFELIAGRLSRPRSSELRCCSTRAAASASNNGARTACVVPIRARRACARGRPPSGIASTRASTAKRAAAAGNAFSDVPERWTIDHWRPDADCQARPVQTHGRVSRTSGALALDDARRRRRRRVAAAGSPQPVCVHRRRDSRAREGRLQGDARRRLENPALAWARDNAAANGLAADAVRWIQDDAATFVRREIKRGRSLRRGADGSASLRSHTARRHLPCSTISLNRSSPTCCHCWRIPFLPDQPLRARSRRPRACAHGDTASSAGAADRAAVAAMVAKVDTRSTACCD